MTGTKTKFKVKFTYHFITFAIEKEELRYQKDVERWYNEVNETSFTPEINEYDHVHAC